MKNYGTGTAQILAHRFCEKRRLLRIGCIALGMAVLLAALPFTVVKTNVMAANTVTDAGNLVVVVRFQDNNTEGDGGTGYNKTYAGGAGAPRTYWESLQLKYNGDGSKYIQGSVYEYLRDMSNGQHKITSYFPQTQTDGKVTYITLSKNAQAYQGSSGDADLISEIVTALQNNYSTFNIGDVDKNNDGVIDNLTVLASVATGKQGTFSNHASSFGDSSKKYLGKTIGSYNVMEAKVSANGYDSFTPTTAAHEYIHTLGIPDYYRTGGNTTPVGTWDPMSSPVGNPLPLAVTRERLGWSSVQEQKTQNATYTLYDATTAYNDNTKPQALKFKTPYSGSEYFVVEYRKQGAQNAAKLYDIDKGIAGSGLIVYRINTALEYQGNLGDQDYVYVFRPNGTDTAEAVKDAQVGLTSYKAKRDAIGTTDTTATLAQGAICYSNGQNSGMQIKVTQQEDSSITFTVEFPDYGQLGLWEQVVNKDGSSPVTSMKGTETQILTNGSALYMLAENPMMRSSSVTVYKDGDWSTPTTVATNLNNCSMAVLNDEIYVLGAQYTPTTQVVLKKYTNGIWQETAQIANIVANKLALGVVGNTLYALADNNNTLQLYKLENNAFQAVGGAFNVGASVTSPVIFEQNGMPAIVYGDFRMGTGQQSATHVYALQNDQWNELAKDDGTAAQINSVTTQGGKTYVLNTYSGKATKLKIFENGALIANHELTNLPNGPLSASVTADQENLYVSVVENEKAYTYYAPLNEPTQLQKLGDTVYSPVGKISTAVMDGKVYCAAAPTMAGSMDVRFYKAPVLIEQVTVTFKNGDGSILKEEKIDKGTRPSISETPTKASTDGFDYIFRGWSPEITEVDADTVYTPVFEEVRKTPGNNDNTAGSGNSTPGDTNGNANSTGNTEPLEGNQAAVSPKNGIIAQNNPSTGDDRTLILLVVLGGALAITVMGIVFSRREKCS